MKKNLKQLVVMFCVMIMGVLSNPIIVFANGNHLRSSVISRIPIIDIISKHWIITVLIILFILALIDVIFDGGAIVFVVIAELCIACVLSIYITMEKWKLPKNKGYDTTIVLWIVFFVICLIVTIVFEAILNAETDLGIFDIASDVIKCIKTGIEFNKCDIIFYDKVELKKGLLIRWQCKRTKKKVFDFGLIKQAYRELGFELTNYEVAYKIVQEIEKKEREKYPTNEITGANNLEEIYNMLRMQEVEANKIKKLYIALVIDWDDISKFTFDDNYDFIKRIGLFGCAGFFKVLYDEKKSN